MSISINCLKVISNGSGEEPYVANKTVKILLIGPLKSATGRSDLSIEVAGEYTVRDLLSKVLEETSGRGAEYLLDLDKDPEKLVVSIDGEVTRDFDRQIRGGETVILTPALSGGAKASVRCLNCANRIEVEEGSSETTCNNCGTRFSITWVTPTQPKIRGVL